jgi:hypothetical protein
LCQGCIKELAAERQADEKRAAAAYAAAAPERERQANEAAALRFDNLRTERARHQAQVDANEARHKVSHAQVLRTLNRLLRKHYRTTRPVRSSWGWWFILKLYVLLIISTIIGFSTQSASPSTQSFAIVAADAVLSYFMFARRPLRRVWYDVRERRITELRAALGCGNPKCGYGCFKSVYRPPRPSSGYAEMNN